MSGSIRLRRRRRIRATATATAAAAAIAVAIPVGLGAIGQPPRPEQPPAAPTLYIYSYAVGGNSPGPLEDTVTSINTATNRPGKTIDLGRDVLKGPGQIAITPDGKTAYVTGPGTVTPIDTATGTPGTPIHVGRCSPYCDDGHIVITPDGKTAYVLTGSSVTPISTATNTPGSTSAAVSTWPPGIS